MEMNTKENIEDIKKKIVDEKLDLNQLSKNIKMAPSKRAIYDLTKDLLLKHNALIFHKGSSLPSSQRKMVMSRVAYGINRGTIKTEEVSYEINKLNALIQGELIKNLKNVNSDDKGSERVAQED
jgi:hypothetical protein